MEIKISFLFFFFFVIMNNEFRFLRFDPLRPCPSIVTWLTYRILRARPSNKSAILTQSNRTRLRPRLKVRETSLSYERSSWERNLYLCVRPEQSYFPFATFNWGAFLFAWCYVRFVFYREIYFLHVSYLISLWLLTLLKLVKYFLFPQCQEFTR